MVFVLENIDVFGKGGELFFGKNGGVFFDVVYILFVFFRLIFEVKI